MYGSGWNVGAASLNLLPCIQLWYPVTCNTVYTMYMYNWSAKYVVLYINVSYIVQTRTNVDQNKQVMAMLIMPVAVHSYQE